MVELYLTKNTNMSSHAYGKYYARVDYKQQYSIDDLAEHMATHNTPFSKGAIAGILRDAAFCIRELTLEGNTVKIDNLAIFKCSVEANGVNKLYDARVGRNHSHHPHIIEKKGDCRLILLSRQIPDFFYF